MNTSPKQIGLIGVGPMAALHAAALAQVEGLKIAYCTSRSQDKADAFAAAHGIPRGRTLDSVMAAPDADALWLVAPWEVMGPAALELGTLGLPLFLEKPVGMTLEESEAVRDRLTVPHMVGLNRRYYEIIRHGVDLVAAAGGARAVEVHMPEDVSRINTSQSARAPELWPFLNSVHLIDLFRVFAGEPEAIHAFNRGTTPAERSFMGVIDFAGGARGLYNSQWYAPGGWRVAVYAQDLTLVYQPIEQLQVLRRGVPPEIIGPLGADAVCKAGLVGQARAFEHLLRQGALPAGAADMTEYCKSVALVAALTTVTR